MAKDLADEISLHLELRVQDHAAAGADPRDAHALALRRFGKIMRISQRRRDTCLHAESHGSTP